MQQKKTGPYTFPPGWTVRESPNARTLTSDELCRCLTGKSIEALAQEIVDNKDGKYNAYSGR